MNNSVLQFMREKADTLFAQYPQYKGYHDDFYLAVTSAQVGEIPAGTLVLARVFHGWNLRVEYFNGRNHCTSENFGAFHWLANDPETMIHQIVGKLKNMYTAGADMISLIKELRRQTLVNKISHDYGINHTRSDGEWGLLLAKEFIRYFIMGESLNTIHAEFRDKFAKGL